MFVKLIKGTNKIKKIYSNDIQVAAFDPSLYGEIDPKFYIYNDGEIHEVPDEEILERAKTEAIKKLSIKRNKKLENLVFPVVTTPMVTESYRANRICAENILNGNGDNVFITTPFILTYSEYLTPKAIASGFPDAESFSRQILAEFNAATYFGGEIERLYYESASNIRGIQIKTTIDDAITEIDNILLAWTDI